MRIAIFTKSFVQSHNDWAMPPLIDFVRSISGDIEVDIYALYYPFHNRSFPVFGAQVHSFDLGRHNPLFQAFLSKRIKKKAAKEHAARPYDLIHAIWADTPAALAAQVSSELNIPMITTFYAGEAVSIPQIGYGSQRTPRNSAQLKKVMDQSSVVTCGSQHLADIIVEATSCTPQIIPFGLCDERFSPSSPTINLKGTTKLITAASLHPVKGLNVLLEAFRCFVAEQPILAEGVHWHIIGQETGDPEVREWLNTQTINLPVTLHNGKPHWEMPDFYRAGDIAWLGSWFESQCFAAMEPAACGIPVAGAAVGIIPEMASAEWVCTPGDAQALKTTLTHVMSNRSHWEDEANSQRNWVLTNATLLVAADRFRAIYEQVTGK